MFSSLGSTPYGPGPESLAVNVRAGLLASVAAVVAAPVVAVPLPAVVAAPVVVPVAWAAVVGAAVSLAWVASSSSSPQAATPKPNTHASANARLIGDATSPPHM